MARSEKAALVTGGARRVGRAIALRLAGAGFDVAITYSRSGSEAEGLVAEIRAGGQRAEAIRADLCDPAAAAGAIAQSIDESFGRLDVLVNNASVYEASGLMRTDPDQMRRLWAVHVESPLLLCRELAPLLRRAGGHIVNMVDLLAERPWPEYLVYCASKAALSSLTLGLARELAPEVTVNGIAPGVVAWPEDFPEEGRRKYLKRVPLGRAGRPEDVAALVEFLCIGGGYITGQIIRVDGGRSIT